MPEQNRFRTALFNSRQFGVQVIFVDLGGKFLRDVGMHTINSRLDGEISTSAS